MPRELRGRLVWLVQRVWLVQQVWPEPLVWPGPLEPPVWPVRPGLLALRELLELPVQQAKTEPAEWVA